ncbi:MAG TPA: amidohydrolase family protein [Saprospiraceae bacterium]|nr:amidohydrolase family protein [Saprospiraceae bacterium]HNT21214.1 amidohydrolase family protein [Saprospiraceae bacterium]
MKRFSFFLPFLLFGAGLWAQETFPKNDIDFTKRECYAFTGATLVRAAGQAPLTNATLVIRKGRVEAAGQNVSIPADAIVVDCSDKHIYPSFIDIYSDYGMPAVPRPQQRGFGGPTQLDNDAKYPAGWNAAIRAENAAARVFQVNDARARDYRNNGFGLVNSHIPDGIVRGSAALVSLANAKENLVMIRDRTTAHFSFSKGSSTQSYPTSLMGSIALLRQTFLDAQWYKTKPASEGTNLSLAAFNELLNLPMVFESGDKWNDLRADKIAREFGIRFILLAGTNEYQRIAEIKASEAKLIVPLNFPSAQDVEDPNDARLVSLADMKHWEMAPGNPGALQNAGVSFALTMYGLRSDGPGAGSFTANLSKALKNGLTEEKALAALTSEPAAMLGISDLVGSLEAGKLANFLITSGPLFQDKTVIHQNWIQGSPYIIRQEGWADYRGDYTLAINDESYKLKITGDPGRLSAQLIGKDTIKANLKLTDKLVQLSFSQKADSSKITRLSGVITGDQWNGTGQDAKGQWVRWKMNKAGDAVASSSSSRGESGRKQEEKPRVMYPFQGYGWTEMPSTQDLLIKNATVWTSERDGILKQTDVLVRGGKIARIGKNLSSDNARVIDGTGKHLTAGIIDEHSHIGATGSINECSQSVTSEVRIADVINPDDINIYRQLSGGVTAVHVLHGSCNTIGGQTQLIKLRWGRNAEEMKFAPWDGFIKFALGENVKRSSTTQNNRFPDTRMGVEQVLDDAFLRATQYDKAGKDKRRDLELDALLEIINKQRFITCHSYVASEILALMSVAEKHGFKVNTFTHILEGYKVADRMKQHGAAASSFSDWWAYKMEVQDAIPQSPYLMSRLGLNVAINSDDAEMARRLNQEAAKSIKYAGMAEEEAIKMVTINPATMLHVGDRTGSIKTGKDADLVIWNEHPLSIYARAEKTIVDGIIYFDREKDAEMQARISEERGRLVQKMISAKNGGERTERPTPSFEEEAQCDLDHYHGKGLWHRLEQRMVEEVHTHED